jgi:tRNA dimethylallyltransferase
MPEDDKMKNKILIICGPTATGKTALALSLAKRFDGELVSADSRQVYRGMDIGTGKDLDICFKSSVPIWMYNVVNPGEEFSVSHYQFLSTAVISNIQKRNKLPIIVGGTGLYIRSILMPIETAGIPPNVSLRKKLIRMSKEQLQGKLQHVAPQVWEGLNNSDRNNPRRLIRKIEIAKSKMGTSCKKTKEQYDQCLIGLRTTLQSLYQRIDKRVDKRVEQGVVDEISMLIQKGFSWDLPSMSALGYKEWRPYFERKQSMEQCIQQWKHDEHGYARRQLTWFKKQSLIHWFDIMQSGYEGDVTEAVTEWYT